MVTTALWASMALLAIATLVSGFWEMSPERSKRPYSSWIVLLWSVSFAFFYGVLGTAGLMTERLGVRLVGLMLLAMSLYSLWKGLAIIKARTTKA